MMKKNIYGKIGLVMLMALTSIMFSCKKMFDLQPKSEVDISNNYQNVYDANSAVIGIYGKLIGIAEQYVLLNELRADLMDVTTNADKSLIDLSQHTVTAASNNPWADPRPMYSIILNCNDVLYNFDKMRADKKITDVDYNQRYADVAAVRCWLYLQLGIHFGNIPYVTDPLVNIDDLKDASKFPRLAFSDLLTKLVNVLAPLPYHDPYAAASTVTSGASSSLIATVDGYNTKYFFIQKNYVLGDLYLWQGNYNAAATAYKAALEYPYIQKRSDNFPTYRISFDQTALNNDLFVSYTRYKGDDINSLTNSNTQGWRSIFARPQDSLFDNEWLWIMNFDSSFQPTDPFVDLFSNSGGRYLVQPSQTAIDNWNSQRQTNGFPYDQRGKFSYTDPTGAYNKFNNQNVIMKNLYIYQDAGVQHKYGRWFLMRAGGLILRYAEAANRDNRSKIAYALLNYGIRQVFDKDLANYDVPNTTAKDVTNNQQTFDVPPYDFDARQGRGPYPGYSADWSVNVGIRNRASLTNYPATAMTDVQGMEDKLILEAGLELAYEGQRWPDLLRIALRRNDPSFLANKVFDKLNKDGFPAQAAAAQAKLMAGNYYLPFNW
ncbi:MAG: RagB/SusD family nutrient uptake outer membrane protein [Mucilaginibacter sp.]|uniref:RagB/SusD family nutrient uptake outer membrane protein n=1 Tax=Mucilaginibacter sp. TaxID=1882438 RepID=UPI003267DCED